MFLKTIFAKKGIRGKLTAVTVTSFIVIVLTQTVFFTIKPIEELELNFLDYKFSKRGAIELPKNPDVVIVDITQESHDQIPAAWPWPRSIFARLIKNLNAAGAKAIGLDLIMSNPDRLSPGNDSLLYNTIKEAGNVVVAGKINISREAVLQSIINGTSNSGGYITNENENYGNRFFFADSSIGIAQIPGDDDGVYRRYSPYVYSEASGRKLPTFAFALLNKYYNLPPLETAISDRGYFYLADRKIPKFDNASMLINFYGQSGTFPHYKLVDILDDKYFKTRDEIELNTEINTFDNPDYGYINKNTFKDKIVLIGSTMPEDKDYFPISFAKGIREGDNLLYGVQVHANAIQDILSGNFIERQSVISETLMVIFFTFFTFFIVSYVKELKLRLGLLSEFGLLIFTFLLIYGNFRLSTYLFIHSNLDTEIIGPSLAIALGYIGSNAFQFISERKQNVMIKRMFSQYVSKNVVNELLVNPDKLQLGGQRKNLSILFSDIAGFTSFSENKEPEELVSFINEFLSEMSEVIIANQGTLDKYLGDAVMAFWGAPVDIPDHVYKACNTALSMQTKLKELCKNWESEGKGIISIRIGVNTGDVIVGNIGGTKRFDYTVMGDAVNLASRLEGANKEYGTSIMISDDTYSVVKSEFLVRELDTILVKGKSKATTVYELIGKAEDAEAQQKIEEYRFFHKGIELYKQMKFENALDCFNESLQKLPDDAATKVYIERTREYLVNPPDENWSGVYTMKTK